MKWNKHKFWVTPIPLTPLTYEEQQPSACESSMMIGHIQTSFHVQLLALFFYSPALNA